MKKHTWITEEVDGGYLGIGDFWICSECGASGGPVYSGHVIKRIFLADGAGLTLAEDCEESKVIIDKHKMKSK